MGLSGCGVHAFLIRISFCFGIASYCSCNFSSTLYILFLCSPEFLKCHLSSYYCQFWLQTIFLILFVVVINGTNRDLTTPWHHHFALSAVPFFFAVCTFSFFLSGTEINGCYEKVIGSSEQQALWLCCTLRKEEIVRIFCCDPMDFFSVGNSLPKAMIQVQHKTFMQKQ